MKSCVKNAPSVIRLTIATLSSLMKLIKTIAM